MPAPRLWQRTTVYLYRALARDLGVTIASVRALVRLSFVKVAEYQRRGLVHYHAVIRLDASTPAIAPPPKAVVIPRQGRRHPRVAPPAEDPGQVPAALFTIDRLTRALRRLVPADQQPEQGVKLILPAVPGQPERLARWGTQLDVRPIEHGQPGSDGRTVTAEQVAAYVAKYATKSTEAFSLTGEVRHPADLPPHLARMVDVAQQLSRHRHLIGFDLGRRAAMLGYGGHWSTKSRRYSTTFGAIRRARAEHARRTQQGSAVPLDAWGRPLDEAQVLVIAEWRYTGRGYHSIAEAALAIAAAAHAREYRRAA
jgi:hypothetical protein